MRKIILAISILMLIMPILSCSEDTQENDVVEAEVTIIGVNQFMEHPLLDEAREGMMAEFAANGITEENGYSFVYRNAGGEQTTANQINTQFVDQDVDMIIALGTPSAQSACNATQTIPVIFGIITDPVASGLAETEEHPGGNKTGTSDRWPYELQIGLIKEICPEAQIVGIVLNPSESNTEASMNYIRPLLEQNGMTTVEVPVANSSEVMSVAQSLVGRCDVMLIPGDNTVIAAISAIVQVANENDIPLFAGSESSVESGAIATYGNDYYQIGVATADIAIPVLTGEITDVGSIPVAVSTEASLIINLNAAAEQGVVVPQSLVEQAVTVIE